MAGRPSKYRPEFVAQARKLCRLGATDQEMADFFEVDIATLYRWKADKDAFREALKEAKVEADSRVEQSLYRRALGYEHDAVKIISGKDGIEEVPYREHYPPDTTACIFWLKNRQPERWRDRTEVVKVDADSLSDAELSRIAAGGGAGTAEASGDSEVVH